MPKLTGDSWRYEPGTGTVRSEPENYCIATVGWMDAATREQDQANGYALGAARDALGACRAVIEWATTPGDHGGNPWTKKFVQMARDALAKADGEE